MEKICIAVVMMYSLGTSSAIARDYIHTVGSTAVFPFVTIIAEFFGKTSDYKTPIVEATGTGGGINLFCAGTGDRFPDIVNTSRPMSKTERQLCVQNNVGEIIEIIIGYDGIVIASDVNSSPQSYSLKDLYFALAESLGQHDKNPYSSWDQINPNLPKHPILVLGPTSTLATREIFEKKVIIDQCKRHEKSKVCRGNIREDGVFIEVAEHENIIAQKLSFPAIAFLSFGYAILNPHKIRMNTVEGVFPTRQTIADQSYPLSRKFYFYVKKDRLLKTPGLADFIRYFLSDRSMEILERKGLVIAPDFEKIRQAAFQAL